VVAAVSGSVSLVAVLANVLVAGVVGPATVLGLLGGLIWPIWPLLGGAMGRVAGWCADWIIHIADRAAALPGASLGWAPGAFSLASLTLLCVLVAWGAPRYLAGARRTLAGASALVVGMVQPLPLLGPVLDWPPDGWLMVACDVGQGDALVLNSGPGAAVVIDAGPDPGSVDRCLRRLGIDRVPVIVLTHFHADHIDGLTGVLRDREVGEVLVTGVRDPPHGADQVDRDAAGIPVRVPTYAEVAQVGAVTWQVVGPAGSGGDDHGEEGSAANNASLVLLAEVGGVRILLTGDAEPEAQQGLARSLGALRVDVLKVPHHGSRYQDEEFLAGLGARLAVVSAGQDNDYGHPSLETLESLRRAGMEVRRTDLDGDVAVLVREGQLRVATSR
ncbi:MAG TPA: ComEC/Rec2 family competence protein, partial [Nocardioidaceae bacterium]|nr:ComEC/Rec2 family competence protein [Nocardioidaceae bacterium]